MASNQSKAKQAYDKAYNARPEQVKNRVARNAARREAMEDGRVKKGDGKDVDHKRLLDQGGSNSKSNHRVVSASANRGWRDTSPEAYGKKK